MEVENGRGKKTIKENGGNFERNSQQSKNRTKGIK